MTLLIVCMVLVVVDLLTNLFILLYKGRWEEMKRAELETLRAIKMELRRRGE